MKYWIVIVFFIAACSKEQRDDCITSLGDDNTEVRSVEPFTRLYVEDRMQVILVQDSAKNGELEVYGPENLLGQIKTDVVDGQLRIVNTNTCNFVRSFNYELIITAYVHQLNEIKLESIATVFNTDTLHVDSIAIYHSALSDMTLTLNCSNIVQVKSLNSAHMQLKGSSRVLKGSIEEISDLDASELVVEEVLLDTHTPLDCKVNPTKGLFVKIFNSGNILHYAEPTDYKEINVQRGTGTLVLVQ